MEWLILSLVFIAFIVLTAIKGYRRASQIHVLIHQGQLAQGRIVAIRRFGTAAGHRWMLVYEYDVDGQQRKQRSFVSREEAQRMREADSIALRYLPASPAVAAPMFVIEKSPEWRHGSPIPPGRGRA